VAKDRREWRKIVLEAKDHNGRALDEGRRNRRRRWERKK